MARDTLHTKCRLCRREGVKLYLKGSRCLSSKCPIEKKGAAIPGMHGLKRSGRLSSYGTQLRAKQKVKRYYGVLERQLRNYFTQAKAIKGLLGENFLALLETRLDNVVYSSGLSLSKSHAKQMVSHQNVLVNGKALSVNSYQVKIGDTVSLKPSKLLDDLQLRSKDEDFKAPAWMELAKEKYSVKVTAMPSRAQIPEDFDENLIIEYYSR